MNDREVIRDSLAGHFLSVHPRRQFPALWECPGLVSDLGIDLRNPMSIKKFLADNAAASNGGAPCRTCRHPQVRAIDRACKEFRRERDAGRTLVSWKVFSERHVSVEFEYTLGWRSLVRHVENCLGEK